jgi:oligo-alginate lyase
MNHLEREKAMQQLTASPITIFFALILFAAVLVCLLPGRQAHAETVKSESTFYTASVIETVRKNAEKLDWASRIRDEIVDSTWPWMAMSEEELWKLVFGPSIKRSWMVWSNGYCPACGESVPMYTWEIDALNRPWKVKCPHCSAIFPTNDFKAFYDSGLDESGFFDPLRADRPLLFNADHPDPDDPRRLFGVDDGEGYREGDKRWRFIGAYLIYGQWKQAIIGGIRTLAAAYVLTGKTEYARRAAILLDRTADIYPAFDFGEQGLVYERQGDRGYVSTWHDACEETREMVMAWDMIFEGIREDAALVAFLSGQAAKYGLENPKASFADIQRNIEDRILRDALAHRYKIRTNYPRTEICAAITHAVLGWPENRDAFYAEVDPMLERATAVDGVTGEKGLAGYASFTIQALAMLFGECARLEPAFLETMMTRHPALRDTWRFHIDTICLDRYYPLIGDTGHFAAPVPDYKGMHLLKPGFNAKSFSHWTFLPPSSYSLLWRLYRNTGDPVYAKIMYRGNEKNTENLPWDLYCENPEETRAGVEKVIKEKGADLDLASVNKKEWHLAILRSGEAENARVLWLDYDAGGGHGHEDGMNLGLFALGLDLMPDFGYPPVQFGGWGSPRARWYTMTAAHNTVVVDGQNTVKGAGATTLWKEEDFVHAFRASGAPMNNGNRYERTALLIDLPDGGCYIADVFRVAGGKVHTKFFHSHFGSLETAGLDLEEAPDFGHNTQMRNFLKDSAPDAGWSVTWNIEDRYNLIEDDTPRFLRYTDFTRGAAAGRCEAWIVSGMFNTSEETWIPRIFTERTTDEKDGLVSTFAAVIDPYLDQPAIAAMHRLDMKDAQGDAAGDNHVALEITLQNGLRDILVIADPAEKDKLPFTLDAHPELRITHPGHAVRMDADQTRDIIFEP